MLSPKKFWEGSVASIPSQLVPEPRGYRTSSEFKVELFSFKDCQNEDFRETDSPFMTRQQKYSLGQGA